MTTKEYIESGILELFVAGSLSEKENEEVVKMMQQHPEVLAEVLKIENTIVQLTAAAAPKQSQPNFSKILAQLNLTNDSNIKTLPKSNANKFAQYVAIAASVILAIGLIWAILQNNELKQQLADVEAEKSQLEEQIANANNDITEQNALIAVLRDKDIISIPLAGQAAAPQAFAKVYWDKKSRNIYLDVQGLPDPPEGKVYQVWSLTLDPLTPTSLGTLADFMTDENKIFTIENANESEAFGITLEPAGGSVSPTLEQLFTLGAVS
jgi:anti-sigma-K factor RskA